MKILSISAGHDATVGLLEGDKIISIIAEEKLSGIKNHLGFPHKSLKLTKRKYSLTTDNIDLCVVINTDTRANILNLKSTGRVEESGFTPKKERKLKRILYKMVPESILRKRWSMKEKETKKRYAEVIGLPEEKIIYLDHHTAHALSSGFNVKPNTLIITLDGEGDSFSGTVSILGKNSLYFISKIPNKHSLGLLYMFVTIYLGMKPNEHEFKVMGLAPYAKGKRVIEAEEIFDDLIWVNKKTLQFETSKDMCEVLPLLYQKLKPYRFDYVAGAIQLKTEELLVEFIKAVIKKTDIKNVALAGGVFMNIKANMLLSNLKEIDELFIVPSASDTSLVLGGLFYGAKRMNENVKLQPLKDLYFGEGYTMDEIEKEFYESEKESYKGMKINYYEDIEEKVAELLSQGKIVARFKGRGEWGSRALGNRSILADASNIDIVKEINEQIKGRDFWMPFAPSILKEKADRYIIDNKKTSSDWMQIGFNTTELAREHLKAAIHPYDYTVRPQLVSEDFNKDYYRLLKLFEEKTGKSGFLNTSFNIHGSPIVYSPKDAMNTFKNSGLKYLAIENWLIEKEDKND